MITEALLESVSAEDQVPVCGSTETTFGANARQWDCADCDTRVVEQESRCVARANSPAWVSEVLRRWPGPIGYEYGRLGHLLSQDQLIAAVCQLKDVAEVLIRLPACVMARDVLENGGKDALERDIWRTIPEHG